MEVQRKAGYSKVDDCDRVIGSGKNVIWSEKVRCLCKMKPKFKAEWEGVKRRVAYFDK